MAKKVTGYLKLQVPAGAANPSPPIGPALGQRGLNIMEFCKSFNAKTRPDGEGHADSGHHHGLCGPVLHVRDEDGAGLLLPEEGGEAAVGLEDAGHLARPVRSPRAQVREIAEKKMEDLNCDTVEAADEHDRRLCPFDGHHGDGLSVMATEQAFQQSRGRRRAAKLYQLDEAVKMVKERAKAKFDETIEIAINLGVDPKQPIRWSAASSRCRTARAAPCASRCSPRASKAEEAKKAGADIVGAEDLVEKVNARQRSTSTAASRRRT